MKENNDLLLRDLCARLPYGVVVELDEKFGFNKGTHKLVKELLDLYCVEGIKPYLRPMSSMTEEEYKELKSISPYYGFASYEYIGDWCPNYEMIDWLNSHHFDYQGLIEKGLAIEAPEGMYGKEE